MKSHILGLGLLLLALPATGRADDVKPTGVLTIVLTAQRPQMRSAIYDGGRHVSPIAPHPWSQREMAQKRKNRVEALRKATKATPAEIQAMGHDMFTADGVEHDADTGLALLERAAQLGDKTAQRELAGIYSYTNRQRAMFWYTRLAETGGPADWKVLADIYAYGSPASKDMPRAIAWYIRAADAGDVPAQMWLGNMFALGKDVSKDNQQAIYWYKRAATVNGEAMLKLAELYDKAPNVHDTRVATEWYIRAVEAHNLSETNSVCQTDTSSDLHVRAVQACKAAYEAKAYLAPDSLAALGVAYFKGDGVPQDYDRAAKLFRDSAAQSAQAAYYLGLMQIEGLGVPVDVSRGQQLILIASVRGNRNAKAWVDKHPGVIAWQLDITQAAPDMAKSIAEMLLSQTQTTYPERAIDNEVEGRSLLLCFWGKTGALETCDPLEENPKGYGFAKVSTKLLLQSLPTQPGPEWIARSAGRWSLIQVIWVLN